MWVISLRCCVRSFQVFGISFLVSIIATSVIDWLWCSCLDSLIQWLVASEWMRWQLNNSFSICIPWRIYSWNYLQSVRTKQMSSDMWFLQRSFEWALLWIGTSSLWQGLWKRLIWCWSFWALQWPIWLLHSMICELDRNDWWIVCPKEPKRI